VSRSQLCEIRGCFVTIEGVEGVGKSTNIDLLRSILDARAIPYISTREPGGTPISEKIRELMLDKNITDMQDITELSLAFAARAQHVETLIKPSLAEGKWVICDRFTDSSYAYQGAGRELGADLVAKFEALTIGDFQPDLTLLLDLPVEVGLQRAAKRGELDRFESEQQVFFERVRAGFLARAKDNRRFRIIDASQTLAAVQVEVSSVFEAFVNNWLGERGDHD